MTARTDIERYFRAWNRHDGEAIDACFGPAGWYEDPTSGRLHAGEIGGYANQLFEAFADVTFRPDVPIGDGNHVVVRWTMIGTHTGPFNGLPPTGASIALPGVDVITLNGSILASVQGYFSESTLLNQLGAHVVVRPPSSEPVAFGVATRVRTDRRLTPGALSLTWIDIRSEEEHDEVLQRSHAVVSDIAQMAGFLGWVGVRVGQRMYTITSWADRKDVAELWRSKQHREAVERTFGSDFASAIHTGVWVPGHLNPIRQRCPGCGEWTVAADSASCACGAESPPPGPFL